ncbi:MAG TPA: preprotein translocase subunit SecG [Allosphingosinicella sp.]|nr:preprotein translocase subunit SecG [Allosphingosinicella sp.]
MFTFLLILQCIVALAMVTVILMQRSEGGGLGVGGSPSGLMSARGAADFLTRATAILATLFVVLSITLAGLATMERAPTKIDPSLSKTAPRTAPLAPAVPGTADPLAGPAAQPPAAQAPAAQPPAVQPPAAAPAGNGTVPAGQ